MKRLLSVALTLFILSCAVPAMAGDSSLSSKGTTYIEYLNDVLTGTEKVEGEIEWTLKGEMFTLFTRVGNDWAFPGQKENPEIHKRRIEFDLGDADLTFGDFSLVLGRGIILSATEDRPLGRDAMLDGVLFEVDRGDWEGVVFYGYHKTDTLFDFPIGVTSEGDADLLWGGRAGYDFGDVDVGVFYLNSYIGEESEDRKDAFIGFDVKMKLFDWQLLYEYDFRDTFAGYDDGRAHYAEVSGGWPGLAVTLQYKDYWNMVYGYSSPPRLRRGDLEEASIHPGDERGYMATLIYCPEFLGENYFTGIFAASEDSKRMFPFHEFYIEYQHDPLKDTTFSLGFDYVKGALQSYKYMPAQYRDYILEVDHLLGEDSLHLHTRFTHIDGDVGDEQEKEFGVDYNVGSNLTLSFTYETSTKPFEPPALGGDKPVSESPGEWVAFSMMYDIDSNSSLELLWGSKRGGYECAGGVCVQKPPFKGIQITLRNMF